MHSWIHGGTGAAYLGSNIQGELFYPNAAGRSDEMARQFFDYYLLDSANGWENTDKVTYYVLGENTWSTSNDSDISSISTKTLYLNSQGGLGGTTSNGTHGFICDPSNPVPTIGGATLSTLLDHIPI